MPKTHGVTAHTDAVKAVSYLTGVPAVDITGYAVIAFYGEDDIMLTSNGTTKAATCHLIATALNELTLEVANDLDGLLRS